MEDRPSIRFDIADPLNINIIEEKKPRTTIEDESRED